MDTCSYTLNLEGVKIKSIMKIFFKSIEMIPRSHFPKDLKMKTFESVRIKSARVDRLYLKLLRLILNRLVTIRANCGILTNFFINLPKYVI